MMPNDFVVGCMLDAFFCKGEVSEAVAASLRCSSSSPPACSHGSTSNVGIGSILTRSAP
jgi:hypothetical protein